MALSFLNNLSCTVFDTETMGLYPAKDMLINSGFCNPYSEDTIQFFANTPAEEVRLLQDTFEYLSQYDSVVTYNGSSFDIPFIKTRAAKYKLEALMPEFWSIDLYRWLKKYWPAAPGMKSLSQKSVEYALGLSDNRTDEIGGAMCISLYNSYLLDRDEKHKELILLHNADDIRQLSRILNACSFLPFDRIKYYEGFAFKSDKIIFTDKIAFSSNELMVNAHTKPGAIPASIFEDNYQIEYDSFSGRIELKIRCDKQNGLTFTDLTKMPGDHTELKKLAGYHHDYLVLSENKSINYREINELIQSVLSTDGIF